MATLVTLAIGHAAPIMEATMYRLMSLAALTFWLTTILLPAQLVARDDGRFANSPLKPWFDRLASGKGLCCSFADGFSVQDVDWETIVYEFMGNGLSCLTTPVVTEPDRFGPTVVWPITTATATHKFAASCPVPVRNPFAYERCQCLLLPQSGHRDRALHLTQLTLGSR